MTILSRNLFTKIFNTMSKPTLSGSLGRLGFGLAGQDCCLNTLIFHGGQEGAPLGLPPPPGERVGYPRKPEKFVASDWVLPGSNYREMNSG